MDALHAHHSDGAGRAAFRHEALLYSGPGQFIARTAAFVRDALARAEPIMVAVVEPKAALLRGELGGDAARVRFIDMEAVGRNPNRIIPAWQAWVDRNAAGGRRFRGIGEPIWAGRTDLEITECEWHEALLNTAFDGGPGWWLVCPYDSAALGPRLVGRARGTHPAVAVDGECRRSPDYPAAALSGAAMLRAPLEEPASVLCELVFADRDDLAGLRETVGKVAGAAGLGSDRVRDLVLAADELASNSLLHGDGTGTLRLWRREEALVCEVRDAGLIDDPLVGRRRPVLGAVGGAGLWIANQVCDLVQIRSARAAGTTVRAYMALPAG